MGKITLEQEPEPFFSTQLAINSIRVLNISAGHVFRAGQLQSTQHPDPFDRLLVAQSLVEGIPLVSGDSALDVYGVNRIW